MISKETEFLPDTYPPFPEDLGLPLINLETVSLARLENGDDNEQDRFFEICKSRGFFYLDFTDSTFASLPRHAEQVVAISEDVFKLPAEEKRKYAPDGVKNMLWGYKAPGVGVVDRKGTKTTNEFFNLSRDNLLHTPTPDSERPFPLPDPILSTSHDLIQYMRSAHTLGLSLMSILASKLHLPSDTFDHFHRFTKPSGDHIRMIRGPPRLTPSLPEIQTAGHTDFGTITILFNWLGGLQIWSEPNNGTRADGFQKVLDPESFPRMTSSSQAVRDNSIVEEAPKWLWVKPRPNCAVINLGDAAVKFTNGLFCSGRHRVVPAPGEQGMLPRYSVAYFVRPEDDAILKTLEGSDVITVPEEKEEDVTAKEWIVAQIRAMMGQFTAKP